MFSFKQPCQVRTGNEEENLQSILRVRVSLVLSRKIWIRRLTVHCWFYYHSWCFDWLWQYNEIYFSWLSIYLNKYFFASIRCALYCISCLFICWNQFKKLFHKFCLCFKKSIQYRLIVCIQNAFEDWFLQYIVTFEQPKKTVNATLKLIDQKNNFSWQHKT